MRPANLKNQPRQIAKILRNARRHWIRFHQFVGSLAHFSMMSQIFKPGRLYLPGQKACVELLVDNFVKANSAPRLRVRL
jgi:hypothetical protein